MSEQPLNNDSCEELLQAWGTHTPGDLPDDLKGRVLQRMTPRPAARYYTTFALGAGFLVLLCLSALWWGRDNPPDVKVASDPSAPSTLVSRAEIERQIASLDARLRYTELESRIEKQDAKLRELAEILAKQRMNLDRAQVRREVVLEWLANNYQQ